MWTIKYLTKQGFQYHRYKSLDSVQLQGKIDGVCKHNNWQFVSSTKEY